VDLDERLQRWVGAGLLTAEQAARIRAFESAPKRPTLLYAIAGLGGLAIAVGIVSIVAANWGAIPGGVKIGIDLVLVAGVGGLVWWLEERGPSWARETAIVVLQGLVLASIALVGQVYQLGGRAHEAMATWLVLTALLMSRARSGFAAVMWILAIQVTWLVWVVWIADERDAPELALASIYVPPLACLGLGRLAWIGRVRPALAGALEAIGWGELVLCGTFGAFVFYADMTNEHFERALPMMAVSAVITIAIAIAVVQTLQQRLLLVACFLLAHVPFLVSPGDLDIVAAASFIALWLLVAWAAYDTREARLVSLATAFVGLRIVAIYFEVFGTLLDTGLALVSGGVLTLGIVWLWARKRRQFEQELGGAP
jgi:uncharacterized membrane protein